MTRGRPADAIPWLDRALPPLSLLLPENALLLWLEEEWEPGPREERADEECEPDERNAPPDGLEDDLEALEREERELALCLLGGMDDRLLPDPCG